MSNLSSSAAASEIDASIWRAVAGACVQIPSPNSYVYYFPQGHLEHSSASIDGFNFPVGRPFIPCQVLSVRFLSDHFSGQVFVKIVLQPLDPYGLRPINNEDRDVNNHQDDVVLFSKILTPSDANNGGGFSVPRYCADSIFPRLDFAADPPVQNLTLKDTNSNAWEFRHIYRGTPRRHLLTTGWSKFVNAKRLVAGDAVVFMRKNSTSELYIGVRRAQRFGGGNDDRSGGEALVAIENAVKGMAFEVVYFPTVGLPDFVVKAEKVREAMKMNWNCGIRVKMAVEADDSSRLTWFSGSVAAVSFPNSGPWCGSPWRMLQITWDEPGSMQHMNRVSPWQVEYLESNPIVLDPNFSPYRPNPIVLDPNFPPYRPNQIVLDPNFPPYKKLKVVQYPDMLLSAGNGENCFPMIEFSAPSMSGYLNSPPVFNAGMQGARLDYGYISNTTNVDNFSQQTSKEIPYKNEGAPENENVSTVLSIGSSSHSGDLSPASQSSGANKLVRENSFQLFGKVIEMSTPGDDQSNENPVTDQQLEQHQNKCFGRPSDKY